MGVEQKQSVASTHVAVSGLEIGPEARVRVLQDRGFQRLETAIEYDSVAGFQVYCYSAFAGDGCTNHLM